MNKGKIYLSVLVLAACLFSANVASATSGSAVIPNFDLWTYGTDLNYTYLYLSNITNSQISVKITLYDNSGNIITDDGGALTGSIKSMHYSGNSNYNDNITGATLSLNIDANKSCRIDIYNSGYVYGYGIIEWAQNSSALKGLVAQGVVNTYRTGDMSVVGFTQYTVPINSGLPF